MKSDKQLYSMKQNELTISRWISVGLISSVCNLRCGYCYLTHHKNSASQGKQQYNYPIEYMIKAISISRMGGRVMFNLCADGETLLTPNIEEIISGMLKEGHFVSIVTNGTISGVMDRITDVEKELRDRIVFKCSLHWNELRRKKLLNVFADNISMLKERGVSYSVECVACDELIDSIDDIKRYCVENFGAMPHILTGRSEHVQGTFRRFGSILSDEEYYDIWSQFDSDLFEYQYKDFEKSCADYFCHAGEYTALLNLNTGNIIPCPGYNVAVTNIYNDINKTINFCPVACTCPLEACFMGHVFNGLGGDYADDYDAGYRFVQFRDRVCADGSHWLTPSIRTVYSNLIKDQHAKMSEERKYFLKALLQKRNGKKNVQINEEKLASIIEKEFLNLGISKIAIYGMGNLGKWLWHMLRDTSINVVYGIDKNEKLSTELDMDIYLPDSAPGCVDAIIVSVYYIYPEIRCMLSRHFPDIKIIAFNNIIS